MVYYTTHLRIHHTKVRPAQCILFSIEYVHTNIRAQYICGHRKEVRVWHTTKSELTNAHNKQIRFALSHSVWACPYDVVLLFLCVLFLSKLAPFNSHIRVQLAHFKALLLAGLPAFVWIVWAQRWISLDSHDALLYSKPSVAKNVFCILDCRSECAPHIRTAEKYIRAARDVMCRGAARVCVCGDVLCMCCPGPECSAGTRSDII